MSESNSSLTSIDNDKKLSNLINLDNFKLKKILLSIRENSKRHGITEKFTSVELQDVNVIGVNDSVSIQNSVYDFFKIPYYIIQSKKNNQQRDKYRKILTNINGIVHPGEMCLVLGRPGAGCSSLLKTISGQIDQFIEIEGDITYDTIPQLEMLKMNQRDLIYNPELDIHFPHLTVDQTLKFAIGCRTPMTRFDNCSKDEYVTTVRDIWARVFGLNHILHSKVGNDFVRGISGGERKRVSIAEAMITNGAVYCWDNATRGLDSSTALEFIELIRISTDVFKQTSFITIYQAGQDIYKKFDKVTVLYHGHQIFFGRTEEAKSYFIDMGFECPSRQSTAEFLTNMTDPIGRFPRKGWESKVPHTALEFEQYWLNSPQHANLLQEIAEKKSQCNPEETKQRFHQNLSMEQTNTKSNFTVNFWDQVKLCTIRDAQNIIGDKSYTIISLLMAFIQSLICGSLFYNLPNSSLGAFSRGGVIFFSILFFSLSSIAAIPQSFTNRSILMKQKIYSFYHPSANVLASVMTQIPLRTVSITMFAIVIYFLSNLKVDAGSFFTFLLFLVLTANVINAMFLMIASFFQSIAPALAVSGVVTVSTVIYSSYMIHRPSMVPWFKWFSYMNPILYGFELMITTEFHGRTMDCINLVPSGAGYENVSTLNQVCGITASNGHTYIDGDYYMHITYQYEFSHVWRNFGILMLFWIAFILINCIASERLRPVRNGGDHLSFIRGAKFSDAVVSPEEYTGFDEEKGELESSLEQDLDSNRVTQIISKKLGSDQTFMWQHINYHIDKDLKLLDDIQGYVKPGTLTALMGESGAGKTTLLNALSQRISVGVVSGDTFVDGRQLTNSFIRKTGYVQQQDLHIPELTVRESLQFAARMRRSVSESEKLQYVEEVIQVLRMQDYADAIVGGVGYGLNVEQRKKLSIATEMVTKPELLLFLDEPTSGLDSQSAWAIVQVLRDLSNAGQLILCTIHQPSSLLFETFDKVLLLQKGGQTVYFGDIGKNSETILKYFQSKGARECHTDENAAEYILECIGAGATAVVDEDWHELWKSSHEYTELTREIDTMIKDRSSTDIQRSNAYAVPYYYQFKHVLHRTSLQFSRDITYIRSKFMMLTTAGLIVGFSFFNLKHSVIGMQNGMFACFMAMVIGAPLSNQIQTKAQSARLLYEVRELDSNTFHWSTLLISQWLMELPYSIIASTIYYASWYYAIQLDNEPLRLGVFWLVYSIFYQLFYTSFALLIFYMAPNLPSAQVMIAFFFQFTFAFSGVLQTVTLMPGFWTFMYKVSPITYFVQDLVSLVLHNRKVECSQSELSYLTPPGGQTCGEYLERFLRDNPGHIINPNDTTDCGYCQYTIADDYLETIGVHYHNIWRNVGFYCVYIAFNVCIMLITYYLFSVRKFSLRIRRN